MKKKVIVPILCLVLSLLLSGCMRISADIVVSKEGKVDLSLLYAVSSEMSEYSDQAIDLEPSKEEKKAFEKGGWIFGEYSDSGYQGYTLEKKNVDIALLTVGVDGHTADDITKLSQDAMFTLDDGVYTFDMEAFTLSFEGEEELPQYKDYVDMMSGYCTIKMRLPKKPISSNATSVSSDGRTLTWDLLAMPKGEHVHVEFQIPGKALNTLIMVSIVFAVAAVILAYVALSDKKKERRIRVEE